jgi:cytochrome P450
MGEVAALLPPNMHPQAYLTIIAQKYNLKGIFYMDLWPIAGPQVVITDIDLMDQVHVKRAFPQHKMADDFLAPILGHNVIATANGKTWKMLHNAMAPAFAPSHVKNLVMVFTEEALIFRNTLDKLSKTGEVFSMEDTAAKLIFDIIARIVFHFPLNAQTQGSQYLSDLREMVHLVEAQLSFNPIVKINAFFKRKAILKRLHDSILSQIMERFRLLNDERIVPQKKDPYSILDLMLREHVQQQGQDMKGTEASQLSSEYLELLITK